MSARRALVIIAASLATVVAVIALLLVPVSIAVGRYTNVLIEIALLAACTYYVARVMRADRRARAAHEAALPEERRPARRVPRRPITFQLRETAVLFVAWFVAVFAIGAVAADLEPAVNAGISVFAAFILATLTVTGRHMMFRLTAEEHDAERER